ncbi:hypothetical protein ACLOJK_020561 [Asimina triloba]
MNVQKLCSTKSIQDTFSTRKQKAVCTRTRKAASISRQMPASSILSLLHARVYIKANAARYILSLLHARVYIKLASISRQMQLAAFFLCCMLAISFFFLLARYRLTASMEEDKYTTVNVESVDATEMEQPKQGKRLPRLDSLERQANQVSGMSTANNKVKHISHLLHPSPSLFNFFPQHQ